MANNPGRGTAAEAIEAWQGPAIVGLTHVFADPDVERRFLVSVARQNRHRLVTLVAVAALLAVASTLAGVFGSAPRPIWPGLLQLGGVAVFAMILTRLHGATAVERLALLFGVFFAVTSCIALFAVPDDADGALVTGSIALLFLLLPVRLAHLAPLAASASGALVAAWSIRDPAPPTSAIIELCLWVWVLNLLGIMIVRTVRLALRTQWAQAQSLLEMHTHDGLTGIGNRRLFEQSLAREWGEGQRTNAPLSVLLVNVDHFSLLNDCIGYAAGDRCLKEIGAAIGGCLTGPGDVAARIGGDEFACLLSDTGEQAARAVAEQIVTTLRAAAIAHPCSPLGPHITVTIGIATARPMKFHNGWELTALADRLLRAEKQDGRNRIGQQTLGAAPPPPPPGGRRPHPALPPVVGRRGALRPKKPTRADGLPAG